MHTVHHWEQLLACRTSCICLSGCCLVKVQAHPLVSGGNYSNLRSEFFHFYVLLLSVPFSHAWLFFTKITYLLHSERGIQMLFVTRINRNKFAVLFPVKCYQIHQFFHKIDYCTLYFLSCQTFNHENTTLSLLTPVDNTSSLKTTLTSLHTSH